MRRLIAIRQSHAAFGGALTEIIDTGNDHAFGYIRQGGDGRALILANVTEQFQTLDGNLLRLHGLAYHFTDLLTGEAITATAACTLAPY